MDPQQDDNWVDGSKDWFTDPQSISHTATSSADILPALFAVIMLCREHTMQDRCRAEVGTRAFHGRLKNSIKKLFLPLGL